MSIRFGPKVDLTDCVLYLDAKNPGSYNGNGSTWYDCSGYGNHFFLENNPEYDGNSLKFNYNGGLQHGRASNNDVGDFGTHSFTIEYIANFPEINTLYSSILSNSHAAFHATGTFQNSGYSLGVINQTYFQDNGYRLNYPTEQFGADSTNMPLKDQITYQVYTIQRGPSNVDNVTGKLYKNSSLTTTITYDMGPTRFAVMGFSPGDSNISNTLYPLYIMRSARDAYYATGSVYTIKMYNRVLTQSEIANNYNVYRQYYGF